jgi:dihydropteroate synthase
MLDPAGIPLQSFAGTLFGVLLGESIAIGYDRYSRRRAEAERRSRAATSIGEELERTATALAAYREGERDRVVYPTAAYRSSVSSGSFALLAAEVQDRVATAYALAEDAAERQRDLRAATRAGEADPGTLRELRRAFGRSNEELSTALSDARDALRRYE